MAQTGLILNLVKTGVHGDQDRCRKIGEALAADERAKGYTILADRLIAQLQQDNNGRLDKPGHQLSYSLSTPLLVEAATRRSTRVPILPVEAEQAVRGLVEK